MNNPSRRPHSSFTFGRLKNHSGVSKVQTETHSGVINSEIENPQAHGFASKAPIGAATYTAYQDGNADNGAVLIVAGQSPVSLATGDTCVYNVAGISVHLNGSKITIQGASELTCSGDIADPNSTTPSMQDMRDLFDTHTHNIAGSVTLQPNEPMN